jgi:outer membrane protein OmpA-like peptidoglycan-associated protein
MENKKYSLFIGILCLLGAASFAQDGSAKVGTNYNVLDSSFYSTKNLPQFNEFRNNAYPFPPKPRNQWEIGIKGGAFAVRGDVPSSLTGGFGVHVRKALGYVFSLRLEYLYGTAKGINWSPRVGGFSKPFIDAGYTGIIYDNYKTKVMDLSLETIVSLTNILFHKAKPNVNVYAILGVGANTMDVKVNAKNGTANYNYSSINPNAGYDNRKDTKKAIKNLLDDSYETTAELSNKATLFDKPFSPTASLGAGIAFKLSKKVNLAIEDRVIIPFTDLADGERFQNLGVAGGNPRVLTPGNDVYNYITVGLNLNLGNASKRVEPLYWVNPLDYAYSELNTPKHMKFPKPILDDADGDGITDQFDLEPNTPKNTPVDSHGVSRDTDGDGVPDYKDKELITPTQCQPVDADGVGKCPEPACCQTLDSLIKAGGIKNCNIGSLPSISFANKSANLSNDAKAVLASLAETIRNNPNCKVAVVGYGESSKSVQQLSWDRVNTVINYLVEKEGISSDRFIFKYGEAGGDANTVDLREAGTDETPNSVPAPHPSLRKKSK